MKVPCIPIYSSINQNRIEFLLSTYNNSAPVIFRYSIETGICISDILSLTVAEARQITAQGYVDAPPFFKNSSPYTITLDESTKIKLEELCINKSDQDFVFAFAEGQKPSRSGFQRMLQRAASSVMPEDADKITVFSLKKTFAFRQYQQNENIADTLKITGHKSPCRIKVFLGLTTEKNNISNSRTLLLENDYGKQLIEEIQKGLSDLEKELYNPIHPDSFFNETYNNLTAFANYLGIVKKK